MITRHALRQIMPLAGERLDVYLEPLRDTMEIYDICTPPRMAAFLAQLAHESGEFRYVRELASGAAYDTGTLAVRLGNTPEADGDGQKYKGRGLIQITGHDNYEACSLALFDDLRLLIRPELLEEPQWATLSAGWFWHRHNLNTLADRGEFKQITKKINGGYNGLEDRERYYRRALEVFGGLA